MALHLIRRNCTIPFHSSHAPFAQALAGGNAIRGTTADSTSMQRTVCHLALTVAAGCWIFGFALLALSLVWPMTPGPQGLFLVGLFYAAIAYFNSDRRRFSLRHQQVTCRVVTPHPKKLGISGFPRLLGTSVSTAVTGRR